MVLRSIATKICPINQNEECFYNAIIKTKSIEIDPRSLTFAFINESTLYPEAVTLAQSAIAWAEELEVNYAKFESQAKCITKSDEETFHNYCNQKRWKVKKNAKDIIARDNMKFKARFEISSKNVYMIIENENPLSVMQVINELGVE